MGRPSGANTSGEQDRDRAPYAGVSSPFLGKPGPGSVVVLEALPEAVVRGAAFRAVVDHAAS